MVSGKWVKLEQNGRGPGARSSHAIAVVGHKVYAFGGEFTPRVPVDNHLYVFDLNHQTWSLADSKGEVPPPRVGVTMASIGHTIYVFGGRDGAHRELDELFCFDTRTSTWTRLPSGPPHRSYHSMAADERRVYVFGGCGDGGRLNDLWGYDVVEQRWTQFPSPGEKCKPRGGAGLAAVLGKIWVVYGFSGEELDDVHCFELEGNSNRWVQVETSGERPTPRSVFCTYPLGNCIVIYGGEIDPSDLGHLGAGQFSHQFFTLDTHTLAWTEEQHPGPGPSPGPRGWCAFGAGQGRLLVYGGNSPTNQRLDDIFVFTPSE